MDQVSQGLHNAGVVSDEATKVTSEACKHGEVEQVGGRLPVNNGGKFGEVWFDALRSNTGTVKDTLSHKEF